MFPRLSPLQRKFSQALPSFVDSYRNRTILPHYTGRGVSSESATLLLHRVKGTRAISKVYGSRNTLHRKLRPQNVTSRDLVHHYIRTGHWVLGRTEMKQRWYPSGILPRTYFAWSGCDISTAAYLRNFSNDLGDVFEPTHRHNRVLPSWLRRDSSDESFLFYDLTSFTSWFHEQVPFLRAVGDRFRNVTVYTVESGLTLRARDLGSLIHAYVDLSNEFPEFCVHGGIFDGLWSASDVSLRHQCAGFLGIPGNLISCTIPHGLSIASLCSDIHDLQVPGDDVGAKCKDPDHQYDIMVCASTLGVLQFDKVYFTPQVCVYLKRLVLVLEHHITLSPMLIFPLLPYLVNPRSMRPSKQFRLPDRDNIVPRTCSVLVSFRRDLWKHTGGNLTADELSILHSFQLLVHSLVGIPLGAIFQGHLQADDLENLSLESVKLKFSAEDQDDLRYNPDALFAAKYVNRMSIRLVAGLEVSRIQDGISQGDRLIVQASRKWTFLEDMGYIRILGIPGETVHLVGEDARAAYESAAKPSLREVVADDDVAVEQLISIGLLNEEGLDMSDEYVFTDKNSRSFRYRQYLDLDAPGQGRRRASNWKTDDPRASRDSLSPEPVDLLDLY